MSTTTTTTTTTTTYGTLMDYSTGDAIGPATADQRAESDAQVESGHAEGLIVVAGQTCWVQP